MLRPAWLIWLPAIVWAGLIFALSAQADLRIVPDDDFDFVLRKAGHMAVFGTLAMLIWRAAVTTAWSQPKAWALGLTVIYAITDELHQATVSGRHASALDVGIDTVGVLIALVLITVGWARRSGRATRDGSD